MVFKILHADRTAIWINTAFNPSAKDRIQYIYVIPDVMATVITLKLTPRGHSTHVMVTYERTALTAAAIEVVNIMAAKDKISGAEWSAQINEYLESRQ